MHIILSLMMTLLLPILLSANDDLRANPENYIGKNRTTNVMTGRNFMVSTSDPSATTAAYNVLINDGTAADAAATDTAAYGPKPDAVSEYCYISS